MAKIKRALAYVLVSLLLAVSGTTVFAAKENLPDSFLIVEEDGIRIDGVGEYFMYVDNLRTGDIITRTITVKNLDPSNRVTLYIAAEPLQGTGPINWLDNLHIKLSMDGRLIYAGRLRCDGEGTKSLTGNGATLTGDGLALGSYEAGGTGVIKFEVTVDADHMDYWTLSEKSTADIRWLFTATNHDIPEPDQPGIDDPIDQPKTGDIMRGGLYLFLALINALTIFIIIKYRKLKGNCSS